MWIELLLSGLVALVVSLLFYAGLARKVYNLQCDVAVTQAQLLREKNSRASLSRSRDKEALELFTDLKAAPPVPAQVNHLRKFGVGS